MLPWLRLNATLSLESLKPTPVLKFNGEQPKLISFVNLHLVQIFMWASVCLVSYYDILFSKYNHLKGLSFQVHQIKASLIFSSANVLQKNDWIGEEKKMLLLATIDLLLG